MVLPERGNPKAGYTMKKLMLVAIVLVLSGCTTVKSDPYRCNSLKTDLNLLNVCEKGTECTYSYKDLQDVANRVARCAYEDPDE